MNGKNHEWILNFLFPSIAFYLGYIHSDLKAAMVFWLLWKVGTYLITCDLDTKSRSRKRLGILGWVIDKMFRHRGLLHSPALWATVGVFGYISIGWPSLGLIIPQGIHIATDHI